MIRQIAKSIRDLLLVAAWGSSILSAQEPAKYVVGFIDHRDSRTGTTGIERLLANEDSVRSYRIDLQKPKTWVMESCDMVFVGSFAERAPGWAAFVAQAKPRLLEFVRSGGILVRMNRYRWADDPSRGAEYAQPDLLPPGYSVKRGKDDPANLFVSEAEHPVWRRMTSRAMTGGWHRLILDDVGDRKSYFLDAFEDWSRQFSKSAGSSRDARSKNNTAALHAQFGRGWLLWFQLTLDKYDGIRSKAVRRHSERFIDNLITWARDTAGTRTKTSPPTVRRNDPPPKDPPPTVVGPPPERSDPPPRVAPTVMPIRGRVFLDLDEDGILDAGEPLIEGATIGDEKDHARSEASGRFSKTVSRAPRRSLTLEAPIGYRAAGRGYFRFPSPVPERIDHDFAVLRSSLDSDRSGRSLAITLPPDLDVLRNPLFASALDARLGEEPVENLLVFQGRLAAASEATVGAEITRMLDARGLPWQFVPAEDWRAGRSDLAPSLYAFPLGSSRVLVIGGSAFGASNWLRTALAGRNDAVILAFGRVPGPGAESLSRTSSARLLLTPGSIPGEPRRLASARVLGVPEFDANVAACLLVAHEDGFLVVRKLGTRGPGDEEWVVRRAIRGDEDRYEVIVPVKLPAHPLVKGSLERALEAAGDPK